MFGPVSKSLHVAVRKKENIVLILAETFFLSHFHCYIYRVASLSWLDSELGAFQENVLLFWER